jgi:tellurite resistance protein
MFEPPEQGSTMSHEIDHHTALIYTMVLVAAAEGEMSDAELGTIGRLVRSLPVFEDFDSHRIIEVGRHCADLLREDDGLDRALTMVAEALPQTLRETAYTLACDIAAADRQAAQEELRLLEILRERLKIDPLVGAAIERAARARFAIH